MTWDSHIFWEGDEAKAFIESVVCGEGCSLLLVLGEGFDPRMLDCPRFIANTPCPLSVRVLRLGEGGGSAAPTGSLASMVEANARSLESLMRERGSLEFVDTAQDGDDLGSTAPVASDKAADFARSLDFSTFSSIIIDISALPQGVYFPLLEVLVGQRGDEFRARGTSLYVFVSENLDLDRRITALELQEDAYLVPPFRSALTGTDDQRPIVWFPILGEGESEQINRVEKLLPQRVDREVCPVLPMPSSKPRRGDMLIREYQPVLKDGWVIDSRSFIYSDEQNPFHLYSELTKAALRHREALAVLGGCRVVISCHSSKLLSLGALLAASDLHRLGFDDFDVCLANVDATSYSLQQTPNDDQSTSTFFVIPLLGEVYAV